VFDRLPLPDIGDDNPFSQESSSSAMIVHEDEDPDAT
jgi:hypothetical protein